MNLILTMAGKYSRFLNDGYKIPKFLLPWGNKTILSEILNQMRDSFDNVYMVVNEKDKNFFPHVKSIMQLYNIPLQNLIVITDTDSQSETVLMLLKKVSNIKGSIIVHNIDTILYERDYNEIRQILKEYDGFIDVFKSNNPDYSYIIQNNKEINEVVEKVLVSEYATSGLYGFKDKNTFIDHYKNGYISEIYNLMIVGGLKIIYNKIYDENNTVVLGTPLEYLNLSNTINYRCNE